MLPFRNLLFLCICQIVVTTQLFAQTEFTESETQMVRSVLERQNTLVLLNNKAAERLNIESVQSIITASNATFSAHRQELLALSRRIGMQGVEGLPPPPYFDRVIARWENLTDEALIRDYLLTALQCHAFIERSMSSQLRQDANPDLKEWLQARVEDVNAGMREIDHLLYELP